MQNNISGLINGSATGEDINILGYIVPNALLTRVPPSDPITINGFNIFDTIELEYSSQEFA